MINSDRRSRSGSPDRRRGPGTDVTRRAVRLLLALLLGCLLVGCGPSPSGPERSNRPSSTAATSNAPSAAPTSTSPSASPSQSPRPRTSPAQKAAPRSVGSLLSGIVSAVNRRDRTDFQSLVSDKDPGFADTAGMIFDNLAAIHPADFALRATDNRRHLSSDRRSVLGSTSYAIEVRVRWAVPGDQSASDQQVWMTLVRSGGGVRWGGVSDGPSKPGPTPLWWLEPVHYQHSGSATVIAGARIDAQAWVAAANTAVDEDAPRLGSVGWNKTLVIIVPSSEHLMEESMGVTAGTDSALAAITWSDGHDAASAPLRIMINPSGQQSRLATAIVLSHETVHVATQSPTSPAPSWLVEGFADYIAYVNYPEGVEPAADGLLAQVKRHGPPAGLPGESDFAAGKHDLNLSYAEAWLACRYLAERFGYQKLLRFYESVDRSPDGAVSGSMRSTFGISEHEFVKGWQRYLRTAAKQGRI